MLETGSILQSRYSVETLIGQGGMGSVYEGRQTLLGRRRIAIKEINLENFSAPERAEAVIQFLREAETLAQLTHPYLVAVNDCFEEDGRLYIVMEHVDGRSLEQIVEEHPQGIDVGTVMEWARQICTVLTYLHTCQPQVIFRDLKPGNVMIDRHNTVRLIDFGISQRVLEVETGAVALQGTPGYAPPEQLFDATVPANPCFDIYALGATLYHQLTGEIPLDAMSRLVDAEIPAPHEINSAVPQWLSRGVMKMLALPAEERFQTALQVREWLDGHGAEQPDLLTTDAEQTPPVMAWWHDGRCMYDVRLMTITQHAIVFRTASMGTLPREMMFELPNVRVPVRVKLQGVRVLAEGSQMCCEALLCSPPGHLLRSLRHLLGKANGQRRRHSRMRVRMDVLLPDRLGMGLAIDLSTSGLRVVTPQPLPVAVRIPILLCLADPVLPDVEGHVEVRWCRAGRHGFESGLQWVSLPLQLQDVLSIFVDRATTSLDQAPIDLV